MIISRQFGSGSLRWRSSRMLLGFRAKMEKEWKDTKFMAMELKLENQSLQAELKHLKLLAELNELEVKVDKMEQEQKQLQKWGLNVAYRHDNCWDDNACEFCLHISGQKLTVVEHKLKGWDSGGSVCAQFSVPRGGSGIFYFEVTVESVKKEVAIGLATKAMELDCTVGHCRGSYGYKSDGNFCYVDPLDKQKEKEMPTFSAGDVIGCGVNLVTRKMFFTKNGQLLDNADFSINVPLDALFPCVSLCESDDKIEANFGPDFQFDVGKNK